MVLQRYDRGGTCGPNIFRLAGLLCRGTAQYHKKHHLYSKNTARNFVIFHAISTKEVRRRSVKAKHPAVKGIKPIVSHKNLVVWRQSRQIIGKFPSVKAPSFKCRRLTSQTIGKFPSVKAPSFKCRRLTLTSTMMCNIICIRNSSRFSWCDCSYIATGVARPVARPRVSPDRV